MKVKELMHTFIQCCRPDSHLVDVAKEMVAQDCGFIPVVEGVRPVGVITDRDIVTRVVAEGRDPFNVRAEDIMSTHLVCVQRNTGLEECCELMGEHRLRRLLVVGDNGELAGVISIDDIARSSELGETGHLIKLVCEPERVAALAAHS